LTRDEWPFVQRKIQERAKKGKKVRVFLNHRLIPDETIKKGVSRYSSVQFSSFPGEAKSSFSLRGISNPTLDSEPATPLGLTFRTPSPVLGPICPRLDNLPFFQLQEAFFDPIKLVSQPDLETGSFLEPRRTSD
jgi:hypothetical protein